MELSELWFALVGVLFIGFFFLEGFDFGVGISSRLLARNQDERTVIFNSIGPVWDANEVWLISGGGVIFAAFPDWYAAMFSGYYIPLFFLLICLIGRGVSIEFRRKVTNSRWTNVWDWTAFWGSLFPPFLLGILFTSMLKGVPIDKNMDMTAGMTDVINVYSFWGGLAITLLCFLHGLAYLALKTDGDLRKRSVALSQTVVIAVLGALVIFVGLSWSMTDIFKVHQVPEMILVALTMLMYIMLYFCISKKHEGRAFTASGLGLVFTMSGIFVGFFPRVMVSSIKRSFDLTVYNASSGAYSLKVMTIVAISLLPFVLGYTIWSYHIFRKRLADKKNLFY